MGSEGYGGNMGSEGYGGDMGSEGCVGPGRVAVAHRYWLWSQYNELLDRVYWLWSQLRSVGVVVTATGSGASSTSTKVLSQAVGSL